MKDKFTEYIVIITLFISINTMYNDTNFDGSLVKICFLLLICIFQIMISLEVTKVFLINILQIVIGFTAYYLGNELVLYLMPVIIYGTFHKYFNEYVIYGINLIIFVAIFKNITFITFGYLGLISVLLKETNRDYEALKKLKHLNRDSRFKNYNLEQRLFLLDRYIDQSKVVTSLKERNYIAQKLHDSLGHRITGSLMQLEVTNEMIDSDPKLSKKCLNNAINNLKDGMNEIRLFLRNVKPDQKSITIQNIRELLNKYQYETSIKTYLDIKGSLTNVKNFQSIAIYDSIVELLTNIAKYSNASEARICIACYSKILRVNIKDDGIGSKKIVKGTGLKGIEERIGKINGRVSFSGNNGFETNIIIILEE